MNSKAGVIFSILAILLVLVDSFEAIVLPRRVGRKFRLSLLHYRTLWPLWRWIARAIGRAKTRGTFLSVFGPLSLLALFGVWAIVLILAFATLNWSLGTKLAVQAGAADLFTYLYLSGVTFFTLGFGDVTPVDGLGRFIVVLESGVGFAFLAIVIGYMPVLYQAFSRREANISLLDARAGSPPSAAQILIRYARTGSLAQLDTFLLEWERWSAELLESTISFPALAYYRSQHDNQSWLGAVTAVLDTCAIAMSAESGTNTYQAQVTFAMARHAVVDISLILNASPLPLEKDRFSDGACKRLIDVFARTGLQMNPDTGLKRFKELRTMYEPFVHGLGKRLMVDLPPIAPDAPMSDNWQSSAWTRKVAGIDQLASIGTENRHFD
jgi:hypothetical protein